MNSTKNAAGSVGSSDRFLYAAKTLRTDIMLKEDRHPQHIVSAIQDVQDELNRSWQAAYPSVAPDVTIVDNAGAEQHHIIVYGVFDGIVGDDSFLDSGRSGKFLVAADPAHHENHTDFFQLMNALLVPIPKEKSVELGRRWDSKRQGIWAQTFVDGAALKCIRYLDRLIEFAKTKSRHQTVETNRNPLISADGLKFIFATNHRIANYRDLAVTLNNARSKTDDLRSDNAIAVDFFHTKSREDALKILAAIRVFEKRRSAKASQSN